MMNPLLQKFISSGGIIHSAIGDRITNCGKKTNIASEWSSIQMIHFTSKTTCRTCQKKEAKL